jgi:hypothetical protein
MGQVDCVDEFACGAVLDVRDDRPGCSDGPEQQPLPYPRSDLEHVVDTSGTTEPRWRGTGVWTGGIRSDEDFRQRSAVRQSECGVGAC